MTFAYIQDLPITTEHYDLMMDELGRNVPEGLIAHVVAKTDGGLRYVDVWETEQHWQTFMNGTIQPALDRVYDGIERPEMGEMRVEILDVYDVIAPHRIGA
jgi:hypothetical protein